MSLQLATLLLEKADAQERTKSWISALSLYEEGISELFKILKADPKNQNIRHHIEDFLKKAENCKQHASSQKGKSGTNPSRSLSSCHPKTIRKPLQPKTRHSESIKHLPSHSFSKKQGSESDLRSVIESEILEKSPNVSVNDVVGLDQLKTALYEAIVLPKLQPAIFSGLRKPPKAILLFGPPGNGKTMIAKAIATESKCTFFSISSSSLTSKWVGQGEKLVRALFQCASDYQPSVIFIDEIDSILSSRGTSSEHEASRRLKTEFLVRFDGVTSSDSDNVLLIAATNLPHELDEAVLRRFSRRFLIGQPDFEARRRLIHLLLKRNNHAHSLSELQMSNLAKLTDGYSSFDLTELCKEAAMWPVREFAFVNRKSADEIRKLPPISFDHFSKALCAVKKSVSLETVDKLIDWNQRYGTDLSSVKSFADSCRTS